MSVCHTLQRRGMAVRRCPDRMVKMMRRSTSEEASPGGPGCEGMASADLRAELDCSICLSLYTAPVSLRCGHNFCRFCIVSALDAQEAAGVYSCPDCRAEYPERPALEKNRKLGNIVERFLSARPDMEETGIFCTYCIRSPVPAVKSCLQCDNSLCDDHLMAHNKTMDHILTEPTRSFVNKKCSLHKKVLEYYCPQDAACVCAFCCLVGEHRGHQVELLDEASEKKKKKLEKYLDEGNLQKAEIQARVQNLQDRQRNIQEKTSDKRNIIKKLFMDIKKQMKMAEKKVLSEISRQEEKIVSQISDLIKKLEIEEDELSRKMRHVEEMCHVTDPIRLLQESDITVCGHGDDEDTGGDGGEGRSEDDLDEVLISLTLLRSMRDIVTNVTSELGLHVPDILLDEDTANIYVKISEDLKTATRTEEEEHGRPISPGRFLNYAQVLSRCGLSSGRHYWEVAWNQMGRCDIGLSYPSIDKDGDLSGSGENDKSWCLTLEDAEYSVLHDSVKETLHSKLTCPTLGVFLDYEAGHLSFFEPRYPIKHLHTFTATFTEPLHVLLYVEDEASVTILS
ncbi:E3 ubiquitin/ISG15 ligase TRIM25-like [Bufo bufo]|uniref:E3 ubiquitin/ISG15 ligase TRIM25-like n=1 Tax=Bufo bufo TaxID=8384 RepID=UPI001ABE84C2|nr:E3 ubiquitin/ISG15 ligase TRIM25-like [Bufo bufo]